MQLAIHPMNDKDGLHTTKPGETYIEQIGVATAARGKGVGKLLLQWAEAQVRVNEFLAHIILLCANESFGTHLWHTPRAHTPPHALTPPSLVAVTLRRRRARANARSSP